MKNYLKLFLILVFFSFEFHIAQASEDSSPEEVPELVQQAQKFIWKLKHPNGSFGTAFAIGPNQFVTSFQMLLGVGDFRSWIQRLNFGTVELEQKTNQGVTRKLVISEIISISASKDLVSFKTNGQGGPDYLKLSEKTSSEIVNDPGTLFALGYPRYPQNAIAPKDVQQTLIGNYGIIETGEFYSLAVNGTLLGYNMDKGPSGFLSPYSLFDFSKIFLVFGGLMGAPVIDNNQEMIGIVASGMNNMLDVIKLSTLKELLKNSKVNCSSVSSCIKQEIENLEKQAREKNSSAQKVLARMLYYGIGVKKDETKAFELILELANQGDPQALYQKADQLYNASKLEEALEEYLKSGEKAYPPALFAAASIRRYLFPGIRENTPQDFDLMRKSANTGFAPGQLGLSVILKNAGLEIGSEVQRIEREAAEWKRKAAEQNYYTAQARSSGNEANTKHYFDSMIEQSESRPNCRKEFSVLTR